jgi:hypothetical protein
MEKSPFKTLSISHEIASKLLFLGSVSRRNVPGVSKKCLNPKDDIICSVGYCDRLLEILN